MFSVILLGLGVDFSIHIISVYTESRSAGQPVGDALRGTLLKSIETLEIRFGTDLPDKLFSARNLKRR